MLKARVETVGTDMNNNSPVVILANEEDGGILPMRIGLREAQAIILMLESKRLPRPISYDLMKNILTIMEISVRKIEVTKIEEGTFYAEIELIQDGEHKIVDSRPSDAINLALRMDAPIYIAESLADEAFVYADPYEFVEPYQIKDENQD